MEALLSLSFDNITSSSTSRIRKGLRQIEGLLAQICLSRNSSLTPNKRHSSAVSCAQSAPDKSLASLTEDPAFREFWRLQESFEWNVASRITTCLEKLLSMRPTDQTPTLTSSALSLLQGLLLLHPPSRSLFSRDVYMNLLFDLLEPSNTPAVQSLALLTLVAALLANPLNARCFERNDGLLAVASLFKGRATEKEVKLRVVEFLYFYLMPEGPGCESATAPLGGMLEARSDGSGRRLSRTIDGSDAVTAVTGDVEETFRESRSTAEKTKMLGKYLPNVEELVADLSEEAPFAVASRPIVSGGVALVV